MGRRLGKVVWTLNRIYLGLAAYKKLYVIMKAFPENTCRINLAAKIPGLELWNKSLLTVMYWLEAVLVSSWLKISILLSFMFLLIQACEQALTIDSTQAFCCPWEITRHLAMWTGERFARSLGVWFPCFPCPCQATYAGKFWYIFPQQVLFVFLRWLWWCDRPLLCRVL